MKEKMKVTQALPLQVQCTRPPRHRSPSALSPCSSRKHRFFLLTLGQQPLLTHSYPPHPGVPAAGYKAFKKVNSMLPKQRQYPLYLLSPAPVLCYLWGNSLNPWRLHLVNTWRIQENALITHAIPSEKRFCFTFWPREKVSFLQNRKWDWVKHIVPLENTFSNFHWASTERNFQNWVLKISNATLACLHIQTGISITSTDGENKEAKKGKKWLISHTLVTLSRHRRGKALNKIKKFMQNLTCRDTVRKSSEVTLIRKVQCLLSLPAMCWE